ncbi:MAG TPA: flagellin [Sumerlaeia bacterium]|nr:flagellin [Sumerlaeia bacterium]
MRISTNYIYNSTRRTIQQSVTNLLKAQEVMATQRRINHLSDDPVDSGRMLNVNAMISQHEQFLRNIGTAATVSELYDGAMDSTISLLKRAKELLLGQANSATSTPTTREAARIEIVSLASQLVANANLQYADRFLFAGFADDAAPFLDMFATATPGGAYAISVASQTIADPALVTGDTYDIVFTGPATYDVINTTTGVPVSVGNAYTSGAAIQFDGIRIAISDTPGPPAGGEVFTVTTTPAGTYVGDSGIIQLEIEQDVWQQINFTGDRVFLGAGLSAGVNLFDIFERANVALRSNDQVEINNLLQEFDSALSQTATVQSLAGSRENLFEKTSDRLLDVKMKMEILLSELRDVDITEAITELNRRENAYQAVLGATAKVLQPNLLDFLG